MLYMCLHPTSLVSYLSTDKQFLESWNYSIL